MLPRPMKIGRPIIRYATDVNSGPAHVLPDAIVTADGLRILHELPPTISHRMTVAIATPQVYVLLFIT